MRSAPGASFHGAVEVNGDEWSYGYCDRGSGVYPCRPKGNSGYTYRESVALGVTALAPASVQRILHALRTQWPGHEYDLLARATATTSAARSAKSWASCRRRSG